MAKFLFFLGKGGVGKSTVSALAALALAQQGKKVLAVSLDPAHNLGDVFATILSPKVQAIAPNAYAMEVAIEDEIEDYLAKTQQQLSQSYAYQSAYSLTNYFDILRQSPGVEEYGLLSAFEKLRRTQQQYFDVMIFDMAPTAVALKFFAMPRLTLLWLEELLRLRNKILEKKKITTQIRWQKKEIETDKVKNHLQKMIERYRELAKLFESPRCQFNLVLNDDKLSFSESLRIENKMAEISLQLHKIVRNKAQSPEHDLDEYFVCQNFIHVPPAGEKLIGTENLLAFLEQHQLKFHTQPEKLS